MHLRTWFAGGVALLVLSFPSFSSAQQPTIEQLLALIQQLQQQVAQLMAQQNTSPLPDTGGGYALVGSVSQDDPLVVTFKYTMNQSAICGGAEGGPYGLYFGDEDLSAGEEPQLLSWPASTCHTYTQYTEHTYEKAGTYQASLYDLTGGGKRLLQTTTVVVGDADAVQSLEVTKVTDRSVTVTYRNLPKRSYIELFWLNEQNQFESVTRSKTISNGSGSRSIRMPKDAPSGTYIASARKSGTDMVVDSETFQYANGTLPEVELEVEPYEGADNAYTFEATIDVGAWTSYTYELDWGEGDSSSQTVRSRTVTVCNSVWNCTNPGGVIHEYASSGLYTINLYALESTKSEPIRHLVATAQARANVEGDEGGFQFVDMDLDVLEDYTGDVYTVYVTTELRGQQDTECPVDFPPTSLTWGDGTISSPIAETVTTQRDNGIFCDQTHTATYKHTYTEKGTYTITYHLRGTTEKESVTVSIDGAGEATGTVDSLTTSNPRPTITGSANVGPVGISIDNGDKVYGSGSTIYPTKDSWSHTVSQELNPGTYNVVLYYNNFELDRDTLAIRGIDVLPISCSVSASPTRIVAGDSVTLTWTSKGAAYAYGPSKDKLATSGSETYAPSGTTTYYYTFIGASGNKAGCSATVYVSPRSWVTPTDVPLQDTDPRTEPNFHLQQAAAYSAIEQQLKDLSRLLGELF